MVEYHRRPPPLSFRNLNGARISSWDEWEEVYEDIPRHYVAHRDADSVGEFIQESGGDKCLANRAAMLLREPVIVQGSTPGLDVPFGSYGGSRHHDLGIYGRGQDSKKSVFIGVETRFDEPFGDSVKEVYDRAIAQRAEGGVSNTPERIDELLGRQFSTRPSPDTLSKMSDQLLSAVAGTLEVGSAMSVLYVIVFRTPSYDSRIGDKNDREFLAFMELTGASDQGWGEPGRAYKMTVGGKDLYCIYEHFDYDT